MSKNRAPLKPREVNAIRKDFGNGVAISQLVKKYNRHYYTLRKLLDQKASQPVAKRRAAPASLDAVNEALSYSHKMHGEHSALFKQIISLIKQHAPEVHRVTVDVENRQATFETLTAHKVTL